MKWRDVVSSRRARQVTILLVVLQLGGCALDLTRGQWFLESMICMESASGTLQAIGAVIWLALALSWIVGLAAIRAELGRPFYWGLLLAIPLAYGLQCWLLRHGVLYCDGP